MQCEISPNNTYLGQGDYHKSEENPVNKHESGILLAKFLRELNNSKDSNFSKSHEA